jgi:hypothetical protein
MDHSVAGFVVDISPPTYKHFCRHHNVDSPLTRFDRRIAAIYEHNQAALITADTPILSLCYGATDFMVPGALLPSISEPCSVTPYFCLEKHVRYRHRHYVA